MQVSKFLLTVVVMLSAVAVTAAATEKERRLRALGTGKKRALGKGKRSKQVTSKAKADGGQNNADPNRTGGTNNADVSARSEQCSGDTPAFVIDDIEDFFKEDPDFKAGFLCVKDEDCSTCCCYLHYAYLDLLPNNQLARYCGNAAGLSDAAFGGCVSKELEIPQGGGSGQV